MTTSIDSKHQTDNRVTAMGGADASVTTIDIDELDAISGGIVDGCTPPFTPPITRPRPDGLPVPGLPRPDTLPGSPLPGPTIFNPSQPRPEL